MGFVVKEATDHRWCYFCGSLTDPMYQFGLRRAGPDSFGKAERLFICTADACARRARDEGYGYLGRWKVEEARMEIAGMSKREKREARRKRRGG